MPRRGRNKKVRNKKVNRIINTSASCGSGDWRPKFWKCKDCGLRNPGHRLECQACYKDRFMTKSTPVCAYCQNICSDQIYQWIKCHHNYCTKCLHNLINQSLSSHSTLPRCCYPNCNQPWRNALPESIHDCLPNKYKVYEETIASYHRKHHLVHGYIRRNNPNTSSNLIESIFDYYTLCCVSRIICYRCKATGKEWADCTTCDANGYTTDCKRCEETGVYKYLVQCTKCNGDGYNPKQYRCNDCRQTGQCTVQYECYTCDGRGRCIQKNSTCTKCKGTGIYLTDKCRRCGGDGKYRRGDYVGTCFGCKGTGRYELSCNSCDGNGKRDRNVRCSDCNGRKFKRKKVECGDCDGRGWIRKNINCGVCHASGTLQRRERCKRCDGSGKFKQNCDHCSSQGQIPFTCTKCKGSKQIMGVDFDQLCAKQSVCFKCNQYFPNDMVAYWPYCDHTFCYPCLLPYITKEIDNNRVPLCLKSKCKQNLTLKAFEMINVNQQDDYRLLKMLISMDNKFKCTKCGTMMLPEQEFTWTTCNHQYCTKCASETITQSLSLSNEIPRCVKRGCHTLLSNLNGDILRDHLPKKYDVSNDIATLNTHHYSAYLVCGYIRSIRQSTHHRSEMIGLIFKYYELQMSTKTGCYNCDSVGHIVHECSACHGFGYTESCTTNTDYNLFKCRGSGFNRRKCKNCNGQGKIPFMCHRCRGNQHVVAVDFNKLCNNQSICHKCNEYYPNNMVIYWSNCYHSFCYKCMSNYIQYLIRKGIIPVCFVSKCKQKLTVKDLKMINTSSNNDIQKLQQLISRSRVFRCIKCHKKTFPEQEFVWSRCNHKYCNKCATKMINQSLALLNQIPKCIHSQDHVTTCNQVLSNSTGDLLRDSLLKRYKVQNTPRCVKRGCHTLLSNLNGDILRDHLPKKYDVSNDIATLNTHHYSAYLVCGYIRSIRQSTHHRSEMIGLIFKYYELQMSTKTGCYNCDSVGHIVHECSACHGFGYTESCTTNTDYNLFKCRGSGFNRRKCKNCNGQGKIPFMCHRC
eukprot:5101_1